MPRDLEVFDAVLSHEAEMIDLGIRLSKGFAQRCLVYLTGDLGAGKTTLTRGILKGLGYQGRVKSPTYALIENYECNGKHVYHFDLYRLTHPGELEMIGAFQHFAEDAICIVEWPERGGKYLPQADLAIQLDILAQGRRVRVQAYTPLGQKTLEWLLHD